jgi:imidazolonepropionase
VPESSSSLLLRFAHHLVFPKTREQEFVDRIRGLSYEEISKNGGGILNSAHHLQEMSEDELYTRALERIEDIIATDRRCRN